MSRRTIDFGIDLGTTNSEIAFVDRGEVRVLKNYLREEYTPSVVKIDAKGTIMVGREAYERLEDDGDNTEGEFKRWMGKQQYKVFKASGVKMNAEELSAEVLKSLKLSAKENLPDEEHISSAVITVPCNFEAVQTEATLRAAKLAGISFSPLLQEPIAASIAYGFLEKMPKGYWVVFDLGGGTFDVAIMSSKEGRLSVVDHCGDNNLGGKDFDWAIVEHIIYPVIGQEYDLPGLGRTKDYGSLNAVLKRRAEKAKIELSTREKTEMVIDTFGKVVDKRGKNISITIPIKREQFNSIIEEYTERAIQLFKKALKNQNMAGPDINQLILVGGATLIPFIRQRLKEEFHIPTDYRVDPITVVAQGAAIFAASQMIPDEYVKKDSSKANIELKYDPMTIVSEMTVGGKIQLTKGMLDQPVGFKVQISNVNGDWQSGMIDVKSNTFYVIVPLREKRMNYFKIVLIDKSGNKIPVEPETFSITQGISVAEPPLIRSIGVELVDDTFSKHIIKGTSLPHRSKPISYLTTREVRPGEKEDVLNIHIREGESDKASRNQLVGTLKITGEMITRVIPKDYKIDIVIKVDQSRIVTAEAFIPVMLDKKFEGILRDKVSPQVGPDDLLQNLEEEEVRLGKLNDEIQAINDPSINKQMSEAKIENRINEIREEIYAAKGGDLGAIEKADCRIKELKETIDPIEHLTQWPSILKQFEYVNGVCKEMIDSHGDTDDKDRYSSLQKEADQAIAAKEHKRLRKILDEMVTLRWAVLFKQPGYWVSTFIEIRKNPPDNFLNVVRAEELMEEGDLALNRQDWEAIKSIMFELWSLIPEEEQGAINERLSDSGIKGI